MSLATCYPHVAYYIPLFAPMDLNLFFSITYILLNIYITVTLCLPSNVMWKLCVSGCFTWIFQPVREGCAPCWLTPSPGLTGVRSAVTFFFIDVRASWSLCRLSSWFEIFLNVLFFFCFCLSAGCIPLVILHVKWSSCLPHTCSFSLLSGPLWILTCCALVYSVLTAGFVCGWVSWCS